MSRVGEALQRKFGPLPAWAWAGIAFVGILFYRRYKGQQDAVGTSSPISPVGQVQDQTPYHDPITVGPGESVYDPNTGKFITGPPGGDNGGGDGQNGGKEGPPGPPGKEGPPGKPGQPRVKPKPKSHKRLPKPKGAHKLRTPKVPHPQHPKKPWTNRLRGGAAKGHNPDAKHPKSPAQHTGAHPAKPHVAPKPRTHAEAATTPERGYAPMPPQPALRQRPAPARVIDHQQQKTVNRPPESKHIAPPPPTPAPKKIVPPKKKK